MSPLPRRHRGPCTVSPSEGLVTAVPLSQIGLRISHLVVKGKVVSQSESVCVGGGVVRVMGLPGRGYFLSPNSHKAFNPRPGETSCPSPPTGRATCLLLICTAPPFKICAPGFTPVPLTGMGPVSGSLGTQSCPRAPPAPAVRLKDTAWARPHLLQLLWLSKCGNTSSGLGSWPSLPNSRR